MQLDQDTGGSHLKAIHGIAPAYIQELVSIKTKGVYNFRRSSGILLALPPFKGKATLGDRSFQVAAPKLWNALPHDIRIITNITSFTSHLKTYLFKIAYY